MTKFDLDVLLCKILSSVKPEIPEKRTMEGKCIVKPIGGRENGE